MQNNSTSQLAISQDLCQSGVFFGSEYEKQIHDIMKWVINSPTKQIKSINLKKADGV